MNTVIVMGRLTEDPELRATQAGDSVAGFTLAVNRTYKDKDGNNPADFFQCRAWKGTADFAGKYLHKGTKILVTGHLEQDKWQKEGKNYSKVVIVADKIEFAESKGAESKETQKPDPDGFMTIEGNEEELPFA